MTEFIGRSELFSDKIVEEKLPAPFDPRQIFYESGAQSVFSGAKAFANPQIGWQWSAGAFEGTPILGYFVGGVLEPSEVMDTLRRHGDYFLHVMDPERNSIESALSGAEVEVTTLVQFAAITAANCAYYQLCRRRIQAGGLRARMNQVIFGGKMNIVSSPTSVTEQFQYADSVPLPSDANNIVSAYQSSSGIVPESVDFQVDIARVGGDPLVRSAVDLIIHDYPSVAKQYMAELKRYMNLFGAHPW